MFSAICATAATVVLAPWAFDGKHADESGDAKPAQTQLSQLPLTGLGGGVTIRELTQHTPFSMVALTGTALDGSAARVRARHPDGSWGPWYDVEESVGARGSEPVFVGRTTTVQISVTRPLDAPVTASADESAPPDLGYRPAAMEEPFAQGISAVLISPPRAPVDTQWTPPTAVSAPGQPPNIISRTQWGADEAPRCGNRMNGGRLRAGVVHHTAGSNDYTPEDSAEIVHAIYAYHTQTLGWCDIGYNALVDQYGQVFEGRAGGIANPVEGDHAGGFNHDTYGVAMIGDFDEVPPTPIQLRTVGRLLGWRLGLDGADPRGTATLVSAGGGYTHFPRGATETLPTIFTHRDVGNTDCPGNAGYAALDQIREIAAGFNEPLRPEDLAAALQGGAIYAHWQELGAMDSVLSAPTSLEAAAEGDARYATFANGAMYWSPETGAQPVVGALYVAWAGLGYERSVLGLPTSGEIQEPLWIGQNFQHGTLNFDRLNGTVTQVVDGVAQQLPAPAPDGPPVQLERFSVPVSPPV